MNMHNSISLIYKKLLWKKKTSTTQKESGQSHVKVDKRTNTNGF